MSKSKTYKVWAAMKQRCLNPNNPEYPDYGGRGIGICEKWLQFEGFFEDMGEKPDGLSLDRIDNSNGYFKENCRWCSYNEQMRNTRRTRYVLLDGQSMCVTDAAHVLGIKPPVAWTRAIRKSVSLQEAIDFYAAKRSFSAS